MHVGFYVVCLLYNSYCILYSVLFIVLFVCVNAAFYGAIYDNKYNTSAGIPHTTVGRHG